MFINKQTKIKSVAVLEAKKRNQRKYISLSSGLKAETFASSLFNRQTLMAVNSRKNFSNLSKKDLLNLISLLSPKAKSTKKTLIQKTKVKKPTAEKKTIKKVYRDVNKFTLANLKNKNKTLLFTIRDLEYRESKKKTPNRRISILINKLKNVTEFNKNFIREESLKPTSRYVFKELDFIVKPKKVKPLTLAERDRLKEIRIKAMEVLQNKKKLKPIVVDKPFLSKDDELRNRAKIEAQDEEKKRLAKLAKEAEEKKKEEEYKKELNKRGLGF